MPGQLVFGDIAGAARFRLDDLGRVVSPFAGRFGRRRRIDRAGLQGGA